MLRSAVLPLLLLTAVTAHLDCGTTPQWEEQHYTAVRRSRRLKSTYSPIRGNDYAPVRITAFYDLSAFNETMRDRITGTYMHEAMKWYSNVLSVKSVQGQLIIDQGSCGDSVGVPYFHQRYGVQADLVIYVIAKAYPGETWLTRAGPCYFDGTSGAPLAGVFEYNTRGAWDNVPTNIALHRHTMAHILGFSYNLFPDFIYENGASYTTPIIIAKIREKVVYLLGTPAVKAQGGIAFGYAGLDGIELEDQGGPGTILSHWEKRIMMNDFMTSTVSTETIYSNISLAVFSDSGWYRVNYTLGENITYGNGGQYSYLFDKCLQGGAVKVTGFCSEKNNQTCSVFNTHKGYCNLKVYNTSLPLPFVYYPKNDTFGGADMYTDYCPYVVPFANGDCRGIGAMSTYIDTEKYGEIVGYNSMCFTGTYIKVNSTGGQTGLKLHSGCHSVICNENAASVDFALGGSTTSVNCPREGGSMSIPGFAGELICPSYEVLCGERKRCINNCYGNGICQKGFCYCDPGYAGVDCSKVCDSSCYTCNDVRATSCLSCPVGKILQGSPPTTCA